MKFIFVILFSLLFSCSSSKKNGLKQNLLRLSRIEFSIQEMPDGSKIQHRVSPFISKAEALTYMMQRRLDLQRLYEVRSDPYFGTPKALECQENIDTKAELADLKGGRYFYMKLLENKLYALGNCLKENNTQTVYYEFYLCGEDVFEVRWHRAYSLPPIELPAFSCP